MSKLISMYWKSDRPELTYPGGFETVLNCDIVVVGGGGSGSAAAVRAAEAGADVIVVEKMPALGGNSRLAGGLLSTYSRFQKALGMPDKTNDYIEKAYRQNKYTLNPSIFRRYIGKTGSTLEWLADHGLDMENTRWAMDAVLLIKNRTENSELENPAYGPGLMGTAVMDTLTANMERLGVRVLLQTKVRHFLRGTDGGAAGVLADGQRESYRIKARSVIVASGGFGGNPDLLRRFLPDYFTSENVVSHYCLQSSTGDAIAMAEEIGAETGKNISVGLHALAHIPGTYTMMSVAGQPIGTVVNLNGKRFIAEDDTGSGVEAVDMQPEGVAWCILDAQSLQECKQLAIKNVRYGDRAPDKAEVERNMAFELEAGWMVTGATLQELAKKTGCEPSALQATIERCNAQYEAGFDDELFKKAENLRPIRTAPFYAFRLQRNFDVTMGGISVNENTQALQPDQSVIPGLYVTGDIASNWMGHDYGPMFSSFAWAINSGVIAGDEAVARMITRVMDSDLVVLGAGGSGLVAAVKASEESGKKVIILEKAKKPGGASYFADGPGVGSQMGGGSQDVTGQFYSWFTSKVGSENMVKTARMEKYKDLPDPSIGPGRGGTFTVDKMVEFCRKQGIEILTGTPARKFVIDDSGKVTGVLADTKDGKLLVNCKACVIASGGFGRDYEKLKKYWPEEYNNKEIFYLCPPGMMGDGIDMAEGVGAYIDQTKWSLSAAGGFFANGPIHHPYSWAVRSLMANGLFVSINLDAKRWMNESGIQVSFRNQPGGGAYAVADSEIVETVGTQLVSGGMIGPGSRAADPGSNEDRAIKKWREDLEYEAALDDEGVSGNHAKKANTLVELALKMKIDPKTFVETIERYNTFCESGKDLDFDKSAQMLKPIKKPPFYAIYGHRFSQCTRGMNGIAVNTNFEVLNPKGETMPGLYAAGDTCTIYGGLVLQGSARGSQSGDRAYARASTAAAGANILSTTPSPCGGSMAAFMSGYSAGMHVAEYLKNS